MRRFMFLHLGFEPPTEEIMAEWMKWFESVKDRTVDQGGFHGGARELSRDGTKDLFLNQDAITGYSILQAEDLEEATELAKTNPFIKSIRVYEIMER